MASSYLQPPSPRRRFAAVALTILVHLLLLLLLLRLGPREYVPVADSGALSTFTVSPEPSRQRSAQPRRQQQEQRAAARPQPTQPKPPPIPWKDNSGVIWLTKDQFAATDIAKSGTLPPRGGAGDAETADTSDSAAPAARAGGKRMYAAEWVREPTAAELRPYTPAAPPDSWGEIVCRMVANNRVDDCQALGESPRGSGLATGLRRASWQFLIRPPRIDGKPLVGASICIHFDFAKRRTDECLSLR